MGVLKFAFVGRDANYVKNVMRISTFRANALWRESAAGVSGKLPMSFTLKINIKRSRDKQINQMDLVKAKIEQKM
jgi:hypothetical protein